MDVLHAMQVYVSVIETGSFTNAAHAMQLHRPAVTKTIQLLEKRLGCRLLNRTTRQFSVTVEGQAFYQRCKLILDDVSEAMSIFGDGPSRFAGKLRVDVPVALGKLLIIPALMGFQESYPDIELTIGASDKPIDMFSEGVDCVVRLGELDDSSLIATRLGSLPMVTCAAPAYLARYGEPMSFDDLKHHRAVNYYAGSNPRPIDWLFETENGTQAMRLNSGINVNDTEAFIASALAGFGLLQALELSVSNHIAEGSLVQVLQHHKVPSKPVSVLYPHREFLPPKVGVFIAWLRGLMSTHNLA